MKISVIREDITNEIALKAVKEYREQNKTHIEKLVFVCFDEENYTIYKNLLKED